jgi:hypothetical protein
MIEVFKTNVNSTKQAAVCVALIRDAYKFCRVNFDLDDCDKILRVQSCFIIPPERIIDLVKQAGLTAEILPDEISTEYIPKRIAIGVM